MKYISFAYRDTKGREAVMVLPEISIFALDTKEVEGVPRTYVNWQAGAMKGNVTLHGVGWQQFQKMWEDALEGLANPAPVEEAEAPREGKEL